MKSVTRKPLPEALPERRVVIIMCGCTVLTPGVEPVLSHEHKQIERRPYEEGLDGLPALHRHSLTARAHSSSTPAASRSATKAV